MNYSIDDYSFLVPATKSFEKVRNPVTLNKNEKKYILLDSSYDREKNMIRLTFYDEEEDETFFYFDKTHFKYHCLTNVTPEKLDIELINKKMPGIHWRVVEIFDRVNFKKKKMIQILTETPPGIRSGKNAISKIIEKWPFKGTKNNPLVKLDKKTKEYIINRAWENKIKAHETFCYDYGYVPGMYYTFRDVEIIFEGPRKCPECGGEYSLATYGYDNRDVETETETIELLTLVCIDCDNIIYETNNIPKSYRKKWKALIKPNNIEEVGSKILRIPVPITVDIDPDIKSEIEEVFQNETDTEQNEMKNWLPLFFAEVPAFKHAAMDIEVLGKRKNEFPSPEKAARPVCCVCFVGSDGKKYAFVLKYYYHRIPDKFAWNIKNSIKYLQAKGFPGDKITESDFQEINEKWYYVNHGKRDIFDEFPRLPRDVEIVEFDEEVDLLHATFNIIEEYPFLETYNGDNFDLHYLYNRAINLGIEKGNIPFWIKQEKGLRGYYQTGILKNGNHLDEYHWFSNRSIKAYVYGSPYVRETLDEVGENVVGYQKVHHDIVNEKGEEKWLPHYSRNEMIYYCFIDTQLTFDLVHFSRPGQRTENLIYSLIFLLMRISKLGFYAVLHRQISYWIRSMFYYQHRVNNELIPQDRILRRLTKARSKAVIEGKRFEGAYVPKTIPGIHFGVRVLDFASLYPSIIKEYNLSYETVDTCVREVSRKYYKKHQKEPNVLMDEYFWEDEDSGQKIKRVNYFKCRKGHEACLHENRVPGDVPHFVCKHRGMGIMSLLCGLVRDFRVFYFKRKVNEIDNNGNATPLAIFANVVQSMLKVFINGSYGVFGSRKFAFYQIGVPESTTSIGRFSTKSIIDKARNFDGVQVVGGDTDSGFFHGLSEKQQQELVEFSMKKLKMDLDLEYVARFMAFSHRKKNYLAFKKGGGIIMKGVSGKKRNTPPYMQKKFKEIVKFLDEHIQTEEDLEETVEQMRKNIIKIFNIVKANKIPPEKLAVTMQFKQDPFTGYKKSNPQHVKVAKILRRFKKIRLKEGDYVTFVKTRTKEGVLPVELVKSRKLIDTNTYLKTLETVFSQLIDCFGVDWKRDIVQGETMRIDTFFKKK